MTIILIHPTKIVVLPALSITRCIISPLLHTSVLACQGQVEFSPAANFAIHHFLKNETFNNLIAVPHVPPSEF
jgi:hypothetical protein